MAIGNAFAVALRKRQQQGSNFGFAPIGAANTRTTDTFGQSSVPSQARGVLDALNAAAANPSPTATPQDQAANAGALQAQARAGTTNPPTSTPEQALSAVQSQLGKLAAPVARGGTSQASDLSARRAVLYGRAVEAAHNLQPGQALSAGLQRRLQLGAGGPHSGDTFAPHSAAEVAALGDHANTILDALRKRKGQITSSAGIYQGF